MNKIILALFFALIIISLIFVSGCDSGKTCRTECVQQRQECIEKNFWGNCVEYEEVCVRYEEICR